MKAAFKHLAVTERFDVARYLEALIEGFKTGELNVAKNGRAFTSVPEGPIEFLVELRRVQGRSRLTLDFSWDDAGGSLTLVGEARAAEEVDFEDEDEAEDEEKA